jgi:hypothetical protein
LLALFCRKYCGEPDIALDLLKTTFLIKSEFLKLNSTVNSSFLDYIPAACKQFAELIYDKALEPGGSVDTSMIAMLESLIRRDEAYQEMEASITATMDNMSVRILQASLYMKLERKKEAFASLKESFQRAIELLKDDFDWNDRIGYDVICKIFFLVRPDRQSQGSAFFKAVCK